MSRRRARPKARTSSERSDDGAIQYKYVLRLHAVLLPDGRPLKCPLSGKNVYATKDKAEKAAEALEAIDGLRMVVYPCGKTNHHHVARETKHVRRGNRVQ